ncbi:MAG: ATP-binding cassette domain-containing protein [Spirochaetales bacterium]|jgi:putative ABC transport system ATP-binding protein|nr:ATP-binding cassette domain-containing protein [Spirochaetales bacterium]
MLSIRNVRKTFEAGTAGAHTVLDGVSLHLEPAEFVTIIGSNGAGKSTLFAVIAGSVFPDEGSIILDGRDISREKEHQRARGIGRLFQDPRHGTAPGLTIEENLALVYSRASGRFPLSLALRSADRSLFRQVLSRLDMGLEDRLKTPVGSLSGGQRQALTLLIATLVPPKLLLLDEHTAALDPVTAKKVLNLTRDITAAHGITTLMITHNISSALEMGTRTIMMNKGRLVMDLRGGERAGLSVEDLLARYKTTVHENLDSDKILLDVEKA